MTCNRPIRNAHPMPSPSLTEPNPPLPDSRVVTPEDLQAYMQQYTEQLLGPIAAWMTDVEMAWKSVFRNTPDVGPLEIDNDSASPYIGMVRDPAWPLFGTLQNEVDQLQIDVTTLDGQVGALTTLVEAQQSTIDDYETRIEELEIETGLKIFNDCCVNAIPASLTATISASTNETCVPNQSFTLTYNSGTEKWEGTFTINGGTDSFALGCSNAGMSAFDIAGPLAFNSAIATCDPFSITFEDLTASPCTATFDCTIN